MILRIFLLAAVAAGVLSLVYAFSRYARIEGADVRSTVFSRNSGETVPIRGDWKNGLPTESSVEINAATERSLAALVLRLGTVRARTSVTRGAPTNPAGGQNSRAHNDWFGCGFWWGKVVEGQAISIGVKEPNSIETEKAAFATGEHIDLQFCLRNFGKNDVVRPYEAGGGLEGLCGYSLRLALPNGKAIPMTARGKESLEQDVNRSQMPFATSLVPSGLVIRPGESATIRVELTELYDLTRAGTYFVSARRRLVKPGGRLSDPPVLSDVEAFSNTLEIIVVDRGPQELTER